MVWLCGHLSNIGFGGVLWLVEMPQYSQTSCVSKPMRMLMFSFWPYMETPKLTRNRTSGTKIGRKSLQNGNMFVRSSRYKNLSPAWRKFIFLQNFMNIKILIRYLCLCKSLRSVQIWQWLFFFKFRNDFLKLNFHMMVWIEGRSPPAPKFRAE